MIRMFCKYNKYIIIYSTHIVQRVCIFLVEVFRNIGMYVQYDLFIYDDSMWVM